MMFSMKRERTHTMRPAPADRDPGRLPVRASFRILMMASLLFKAVGSSVALADALPHNEGQGRYIVYLEPAVDARFADTASRGPLLEDWQATLGARISVERQLATGGWVLTTERKDDTAGGKPDQQTLLEGLEGVTSVEVDALMRHY